MSKSLYWGPTNTHPSMDVANIERKHPAISISQTGYNAQHLHEISKSQFEEKQKLSYLECEAKRVGLFLHSRLWIKLFIHSLVIKNVDITAPKWQISKQLQWTDTVQSLRQLQQVHLMSHTYLCQYQSVGSTQRAGRGHSNHYFQISSTSLLELMMPLFSSPYLVC